VAQRRHARAWAFLPTIKRRLVAAVTEAAARTGLDAAADEFNRAAERLEEAAKAWAGRADLAAFAVAALRAADPALTEEAAIERARVLLDLPAAVVAHAVYSGQPATPPAHWNPEVEAATQLRAMMDTRRKALEDGSERLDRTLRAFGDVLIREDPANPGFYQAVRDAVVEASRQGMSNFRIHKSTGIDFATVAEMTGKMEPNPRERMPIVDKVIQSYAAVWAWANPKAAPPREYRAAANSIDTRDLGELKARLVALGVEERAADLVGRERRALDLLWDTHLHHNDYSDPRYTRIASQLSYMRSAGMQGVVILSPIPQRGRGVFTAGSGTFYYAQIGVVRLGITFGVPMLRMHGKFPDVRLFDGVRALRAKDPDLGWRAVPGISGARVDIPGARGYLHAMLITHPDLAYAVAETTFAKEGVTRLLGRQAAHVLNPDYLAYAGKLIDAARHIK